MTAEPTTEAGRALADEVLGRWLDASPMTVDVPALENEANRLVVAIEAEARVPLEARVRELEAALQFIADWADDCSPDDTVFGFAAIAKQARAALTPEVSDDR